MGEVAGASRILSSGMRFIMACLVFPQLPVVLSWPNLKNLDTDVHGVVYSSVVYGGDQHKEDIFNDGYAKHFERDITVLQRLYAARLLLAPWSAGGLSYHQAFYNATQQSDAMQAHQLAESDGGFVVPKVIPTTQLSPKQLQQGAGTSKAGIIEDLAASTALFVKQALTPAPALKQTDTGSEYGGGDAASKGNTQVRPKWSRWCTRDLKYVYTAPIIA